MDIEGSKEAVASGHLFGFIPHRLIVEGHPELRVLPFNIMFSRYRNGENGTTIMGSTLYEPDMTTFKVEGTEVSMVYRNKYGGNHWVVITYKTDEKTWRGEKFVKGKFVLEASGKDNEDEKKGWYPFFIHLTMGGLSEGEACELETIQNSGAKDPLREVR